MSYAIACPLRVLTVLLLMQNADFLQVVQHCPPFCTCDMWLQLRRASCRDIHLYSIYTGVSGDVQAFDLFNNSVSSLADNELLRAGLTQLKYLNLSLNSINVIGQKAFNNLGKLAVLDLSKNHLDYLAPDTFVYNKELKVLRLDFNKFNMNVPKLRSSSIIELGLQGCKIYSLPIDIFTELKNLQYLDISNNMMVQIDSRTLLKLPRLQFVYLQGNNWSCNSMMRQLLSYLRAKSISYKLSACETLALKKSEKMILKDTTTLKNKHYENYFDEDNFSSTWNTAELPIGILKNVTENLKDVSPTKMKDLSPYWLLAIGFLFGSAVTIIVTYILLSTTLFCFRPLNRTYFRNTMTNGTSQRVSLLHNAWQSSGVEINDNASQRPVCPGTPPPPYREVMLHRNVYPNPSTLITTRLISSNTNDSSACT